MSAPNPTDVEEQINAETTYLEAAIQDEMRRQEEEMRRQEEQAVAASRQAFIQEEAQRRLTELQRLQAEAIRNAEVTLAAQAEREMAAATQAARMKVEADLAAEAHHQALSNPYLSVKMTTWRVLLSSKLWNQEAFATAAEEEGGHALLTNFAQSKGRAAMKIMPVKGDSVIFIWKGHRVMEGQVTSEGFISGDAHRQQHRDFLRTEAPAHQQTSEFALISNIKVLKEQVPIPFAGQRTWSRM